MNRNQSPLVSVIALCYNHASYLVECLESIRNQTYQPIELIIIDDCSKDDSVALINRWISENHYDCKFIAHEKNGGICKALNQALSIIHGEFVSIIATDDVWMENKIEQQVEIFLAAPKKNIGVVYGDAYLINEKGQSLDGLFIETYRSSQGVLEGNLFSTLLKKNFIPAPSVLIKRACYGKVGGYDEELCYEDYDMWLRIAQHYEFAFCPTINTKYRVLSNSLSRRMTHQLSLASCESNFKIYKKCLHYSDLKPQDRLYLNTLFANCIDILHEKQSPQIIDHLTYMMKTDPQIKTFVFLFLSRLKIPHMAQKTIVNFLRSLKQFLRS